MCLNSADDLVKECKYDPAILREELQTKCDQVFEWLKAIVDDVDKWKIRKEVHINKGISLFLFYFLF